MSALVLKPENSRVRVRYHFLDSVRGLAIINMIAFHFLWDAVNIASVSIPWYSQTPGRVWQQLICWTFIFISGFCTHFSHNRLRSAVIVSAAGVLVSLVTIVFMPSAKVIFGILTLIGFCLAFTAALNKPLCRLPALPACLVCFLLFLLLKNLPLGYISFGSLKLLELPKSLYSGYAATFLGFVDPDFYSADYFPVIPWIFLFLTGYFLSLWFKNNNCYPRFLSYGFSPLAFIGRHSLIIYLLHQPILYLLTIIIFRLF